MYYTCQVCGDMNISFQDIGTHEQFCGGTNDN